MEDMRTSFSKVMTNYFNYKHKFKKVGKFCETSIKQNAIVLIPFFTLLENSTKTI